MSVVDEESLLVRRAADGDREAFSELASCHWRRLLALARSVTADLDAEDVVQDGLIRAWQKLGSLREPTAFHAWLTRIVMTTALSHVRRSRNQASLDESTLSVSDAESHDHRMDVARLLARLAPRQRAVLHLTTFEGMTDEEIGSVLGIAASSVRVHRLRGRQRLVQLVQGGSR